MIILMFYNLLIYHYDIFISSTPLCVFNNLMQNVFMKMSMKKFQILNNSFHPRSLTINLDNDFQMTAMFQNAQTNKCAIPRIKILNA